jgi:hypothetical protein
MRTWAWREGFFNQEGCEWVTGAGLGREVIEVALKGLELSATAKASVGDNMCYFIEHGNTDAKDEDGDELVFEDQYYTVNERKYSVSYLPSPGMQYIPNQQVVKSVQAQNTSSPSTTSAAVTPSPPSLNTYTQLTNSSSHNRHAPRKPLTRCQQ